MAYLIEPLDWLQFDDWKEEEHPRDEGGKFTAGVSKAAHAAARVIENPWVASAIKYGLIGLGYHALGWGSLGVNRAMALVKEMRRTNHDSWRDTFGKQLGTIKKSLEKHGTEKQIVAVERLEEATENGKVSRQDALAFLEHMAQKKPTGKTHSVKDRARRRKDRLVSAFLVGDASLAVLFQKLHGMWQRRQQKKRLADELDKAAARREVKKPRTAKALRHLSKSIRSEQLSVSKIGRFLKRLATGHRDRPAPQVRIRHGNR